MSEEYDKWLKMPEGSVANGLLFGFGVEKWMLGGIVSFSNASTALITPVRPDAPSVCPMFGFTCWHSLKY